MNIQSSAASASGYQPIRRHEYFPAFDYIRIIAALGVFVTHADDHGLLPVKDLGNACVQVFFALSGFLIGGIILKSAPADLPRFYYNRAARIWIPYAIALCLILAVTVVKQPLGDPKLWEFFFYKATFVYNWFGPSQLASSWERMPLQGTGNHFWSICVEEQFYLVAPFLLLFLNRQLAVASLIAVFVLNLIYPHFFAAIALGVLLAASRQRFGDWYCSNAGRAAVCLVGASSLLERDGITLVHILRLGNNLNTRLPGRC